MNLVVVVALILLPALWPAAGGRAADGGPTEVGLTEEEVARSQRPLDEELPRLVAIRKAWRKGDWGEAEKLWARLAEGKLTADQRLEIDYLRARMWLEAKKPEEALPFLDRCPEEWPLMADWCRFHAGQAQLDRGEPALAADRFDRVTPAFASYRKALEQGCIAALESGDGARFGRGLATFRERWQPSARLLALAARLALDEGRGSDAAALVREVESFHPESSAAKQTAEVVKRLKAEGLESELALGNDEKLQRAERLLARFRYPEAIALAAEVAAGAARGGDEWCRSRDLEARAQARRREQTLSLPHFREYFSECRSQAQARSYYLGVEAAFQAGNQELSGEWVELLLADHQASTLCDDALLFLARVQERKGEAEQSRKTIDRLLRDFPSGDMAVEAVWRQVWGLYLEKKDEEALKLVEEVLPRLPARADYQSDGRLLYWSGRMLYRLGRKAEARGRWEEVLTGYPLSWYGLLAWLRLEHGREGRGEKVVVRARAESRATLPTEGELLRSPLAASPRFRRAMLFLRLGLPREARSELEAASDGQGREAALLAAALLHRAGDYARSHQIVRRQVAEYGYSWPPAAEPGWWLVAFPLPYAEQITASAAATGLPASLVAAIIREESGFDPRIESYAHALGLMQLLSKTAAFVRKAPVSRKELFDPAVNIDLGSRYLAWLLSRFGHPVLAVAGYNAGPRGVERTLKQVRSREIDEFVETIPFDQTRRYTKRVLQTAWTYQQLYSQGAALLPMKLRFAREAGKGKNNQR